MRSKSVIIELFMVISLLLFVFPMAAMGVVTSAINIPGVDGISDSYDILGTSVAIDNNYVIVGASGDKNNVGAAYVFTRELDTWSMQEKLVAQGVSTYDFFGKAVSISQNYAIIGAPFRNSYTGSAYIFKRDGGSWLQTFELKGSDSTTKDYFGSSVSIYENNAIVGVPFDYTTNGQSGSVYIFNRQGDTWKQQSKLVALASNGGSAGDQFGASVAISENYAVVGAPYDDYSNNSGTYCSSAGSVYIYELINNTEKRINRTDAVKDLNFGRSVAVAGEYAVIGALNKAYIYKKVASAWVLQGQPLTGSNNFGVSVSISSSQVIVGADGNGTQPGAAYIYTLSGGLSETINSPDGIRDLFGTSVAISNEFEVIGASGFDTYTETNTGNAYFYPDIADSAINTPPAFEPIDNIAGNGSPVSTPFVVKDDSASVSIVSVVSDNQELVQNAKITVSPSFSLLSNNEAPFSISITPETQDPPLFGRANITITAKDSDGKESSETFSYSMNRAPVIGNITSTQTILEEATLNLPFNVSDEDGDTLTISVESDDEKLVPAGSITINNANPPYLTQLTNKTAALNLKITPPVNENGNAKITITVSDGTDETASASFTLIVSPVNDLPTISDIPNQTTDEDIVSTLEGIKFTVDDIDQDSTTLVCSAVSSNHTLLLDDDISFETDTSGSVTNRILSITHLIEDAYGSSVITVTVTDNNGGKASKTFTLTVNPVAESPEISQYTSETDIDPEFETVEMTEGEENRVVYFSVRHGDGLEMELTINSTNQAVLPNANIIINGLTDQPYTPELIAKSANIILTLTPANNGETDIIVTATASDGKKDVKTFLLKMIAVNDLPTITLIDDQTTEEDVTSDPISFTIGDEETSPANLIVTATYEPGTADTKIIDNIVIGGTGADRTLTITPVPNKSGTSVVTVTVKDDDTEKPESATETFKFEVTAANDKPSINIQTTTISTKEDTPTTVISFEIADIDVEDLLNVTATPVNAALVPADSDHVNINGAGASYVTSLGGDSETVSLILTPAENANGTSAIIIKVSDGTTEDDVQGIVQLTVTPVNDPPTLTGIENNETFPTNEETPVEIEITLDDIDTPLDNLVITKSSDTITVIPDKNIVITGTGDKRTITITPEPDQNGKVGITMTVNDKDSADPKSTTILFYVDVEAVNDPPEVSKSEPDGSGVELIRQGGLITLTEDDKLQEIKFSIADSDTPSNYITVRAESTGNVDLIPNSFANLRVEVIDPDLPENNGYNRKLIISPAPDANSYEFGTAPILLTLNDNTGTETATSELTFSIQVDPVNDPPIFEGIDERITIATEEEIVKDIEFTLVDVDSLLSDITIDYESSDPDIVSKSDIIISGTTEKRTITITPAPDKNGGPVYITLTANDQAAQNNISKISFPFRIGPLNDSPSISDIDQNQLFKDIDENQTDYYIDFTVTDPDTDAGNITVRANSLNEALIANSFASLRVEFIEGDTVPAPEDPNTNRRLIIKPELNANSYDLGEATIEITLNDNENEDTSEFTLPIIVQVQPVNSAPTLGGISKNQLISADEGIAEPIELTVTDIDTALDSVEIRLKKASTVDDPAVDPELTALVDIEITGAGENRILSITPKPTNEPVNVDITIWAFDGDLESEPRITFTLAINSMNEPPDIIKFGKEDLSANTPLWTNEDEYLVDPETLLPFVFEVTDEDTPTKNLTVSASSSEPALVPDENLRVEPVEGSDNKWVLHVKPATDANIVNVGKPALITLTVNDNSLTETATNSKSYPVYVKPVNDAPTISGISDGEIRIAKEGEPTELDLIFEDVDSAPENIKLISIHSSHPEIVDNQNIKETGTNTERTLTITPEDTGNPSNVDVTLTVTDGEDSTVLTFTLAIDPINDPPTIESDIIKPNQVISMPEDSTKKIPFIIIDETPENVTMTIESANGELIPGGYPNIYTEKTVNPGEYNLVLKPLAGVNSDMVGYSEITITLNDNTQSETAENIIRINLYVSRDNDAPTITADYYSLFMDEGTEKDFNFSVNDIDKDDLSILLSINPADGSIPHDGQHFKLNGVPWEPTTPHVLTNTEYSTGPLTMTIRHEGDVVSDLSLTVTVTDIDGLTIEKIFTLTINQLDDEPVIYLEPPGPKVTAVDTPIKVTFRVEDPDTPRGELSVIATSNNTDLVSQGGITKPAYNESTGRYDMTITPEINQSGDAEILIQVFGGGSEEVPVEASFQLFVYQEVDETPQIFVISPQFVVEDEADVEKKKILFTILDKDTLGKDLNVQAYPSTGTEAPLVPKENISAPQMVNPAPADPNAPNWYVIVTPGENISGTAKITITVTDPQSNTDTKEFDLVIHGINDPPELSGNFSPINIKENSSGVIRFDLTDPEGGIISLTANSDRADLISSVNLDIADAETGVPASKVEAEAGVPLSFELIIKPNLNATTAGDSPVTITLTASDDSGSVNYKTYVDIQVTIGPVDPGDINNDDAIDLIDAILALKAVTGIEDIVNVGADINDDDKIGLEEVIYIMQVVAGIRASI